MKPDPRHVLGQEAEHMAQAWLERRGLDTVCRNWRGRRGELDIVMQDGPVLVIVEVRARIGGTHEDARVSVGRTKARRIGAAIREYLAASRLGDTMPVRVDVVTVAGVPGRPTVRWWRDAVRTGV